MAEHSLGEAKHTFLPVLRETAPSIALCLFWEIHLRSLAISQLHVYPESSFWSRFKESISGIIFITLCFSMWVVNVLYVSWVRLLSASWGKEAERDKEKDGERETKKKMERGRQRELEIKRKMERDIERDRDREGDRQKDRRRERYIMKAQIQTPVQILS